jgi:DNA-binding protein YbaB
MPRVSDTVTDRSHGATRVDVDIEAESPDGEDALALTAAITEAVNDAIDQFHSEAPDR